MGAVGASKPSRAQSILRPDRTLEQGHARIRGLTTIRAPGQLSHSFSAGRGEEPMQWSGWHVGAGRPSRLLRDGLGDRELIAIVAPLGGLGADVVAAVRRGCRWAAIPGWCAWYKQQRCRNMLDAPGSANAIRSRGLTRHGVGSPLSNAAGAGALETFTRSAGSAAGTRLSA